VTAIPLGRPLPAASSNQPGRRLEDEPCTHSMRLLARNRAVSPLFGFAPGGACRAAPVTSRAVRSYRTVSPLPPACRVRTRGRGGLFSVALSLGSPPPDVIRHRVSLEPGLSSASRRRPSGRLARRSSPFPRTSVRLFKANQPGNTWLCAFGSTFRDQNAARSGNTHLPQGTIFMMPQAAC